MKTVKTKKPSKVTPLPFYKKRFQLLLKMGLADIESVEFELASVEHAIAALSQKRRMLQAAYKKLMRRSLAP